MRRFLVWYLPVSAAVVAAVLFGGGFYSFLSGDTGTSVSVMPSSRVVSSAPREQIAPIILGDSLGRGTGDETGLGIGGRFVDELKARHVNTRSIVNIAVEGAKTPDLIQQLASHNVQTLLAQSNVIIVSIGGNDLLGGANNFRNTPPPDPERAMGDVLDRVVQIVRTIRGANPAARVFVIGLYNPYVTSPFGKMLTPFVNRWNALLVQRFAADPNMVIVQTSDLFAYRDRLSLDRFHPNDEGYALIARRIADAI